MLCDSSPRSGSDDEPGMLPPGATRAPDPEKMPGARASGEVEPEYTPLVAGPAGGWDCAYATPMSNTAGAMGCATSEAMAATAIDRLLTE